MNENEKEYYEKFKSDKISDEDIKKGEAKAKNLGDKKNDFLTLIEMLKASFSGEFELPVWAIASIIGAIIYVVSPIDAVPDFIPVAGWLDDAGIVTTAVAGLGTIIAAFLEYKEKKIKITRNYLKKLHFLLL